MSTPETSLATAAAGHPKVTLPQIIGAVVAGVPVVSNLLAAFGVFTPTPSEQHALVEALNWGVAFAGLLIAGDAGLRSARNAAAAKVAAAHVVQDAALESMRSPAAAQALFSTPPPPPSELAGLPPDVADHDGPGDVFDPIPHVPVTDPADVPPDEVDQADASIKLVSEANAARAHRQNRMQRYRLTEHERAVAKALLLPYLTWALNHRGSVHYTQNAKLRWEAIEKHLLIRHGGKLTHGDCSSTGTWLLRNVAYRFGFHEDVFNGEHYDGGYTGTLIKHGRPVHYDKNLRFGDLIFYGNQGGGVPEHVAVYIGGGMVWSHGSDAGPFKLHIDYRPDRVAARRYF